jgi:hypothetical protein
MDKKYLIDRFKTEGIRKINRGRLLSFQDFYDLELIQELVNEGLVSVKKEGFWKSIFSSGTTYIWVGESNRVFNEVDPYGDWNT